MASHAERSPSGATYRETPGDAGPPPAPDYVDQDPRWIRLDNNTNPESHPVVRRTGDLATTLELNRYGSAWGARLRAALAKFYDLPEDRFLVGDGSDEILDAAARAFLGPGRRGGMFRPGYDIHASLVLRTGASLREVFLEESMDLPESNGWARGVDLLFVSSPSNPTGRSLSAGELRRVARSVRGVVVVDEAYAEYADVDLWTEGFRCGNVLFTRTFSKAWGLAGLRVGYGIGPSDLVDLIQRSRIPFTLGTLSEELAIGALEDPSFVRKSVRTVRGERVRLVRSLRQRGFHVFPSTANFVLTYPPIDGARLARQLRRRGILVRRVASTAWCSAPLRITVGRATETDVLLRVLDDLLENGSTASVPGKARRRTTRRGPA